MSGRGPESGRFFTHGGGLGGGQEVKKSNMAYLADELRTMVGKIITYQASAGDGPQVAEVVAVLDEGSVLVRSNADGEPFSLNISCTIKP